MPSPAAFLQCPALAGRRTNEGHSKGLIKYSNFPARQELLCMEKVEATELCLLSGATIAWSASPRRLRRGRGCGEGAVVVVVFQRKVIGVLEGLRGLPACVLRSPAPSQAARAKRLSLQLAGRPRLWATRPAPASRHPGSRKGRCPHRANLPPASWVDCLEPSKAKWVQLPQPSGSSSPGGLQTRWLSL